MGVNHIFLYSNVYFSRVCYFLEQITEISNCNKKLNIKNKIIFLSVNHQPRCPADRPGLLLRLVLDPRDAVPTQPGSIRHALAPHSLFGRLQ